MWVQRGNWSHCEGSKKMTKKCDVDTSQQRDYHWGRKRILQNTRDETLTYHRSNLSATTRESFCTFWGLRWHTIPRRRCRWKLKAALRVPWYFILTTDYVTKYENDWETSDVKRTTHTIGVAKSHSTRNNYNSKNSLSSNRQNFLNVPNKSPKRISTKHHNINLASLSGIYPQQIWWHFIIIITFFFFFFFFFVWGRSLSPKSQEPRAQVIPKPVVLFKVSYNVPT